MVLNALEFLRCKLRNVIDSAEFLTCHGCHGTTTENFAHLSVQNGD